MRGQGQCGTQGRTWALFLPVAGLCRPLGELDAGSGTVWDTGTVPGLCSCRWLVSVDRWESWVRGQGQCGTQDRTWALFLTVAGLCRPLGELGAGSGTVWDTEPYLGSVPAGGWSPEAAGRAGCGGGLQRPATGRNRAQVRPWSWYQTTDIVV